MLIPPLTASRLTLTSGRVSRIKYASMQFSTVIYANPLKNNSEHQHIRTIKFKPTISTVTLSDKVFKSGVGGNCGFERLVKFLYILLLERTVCGPEVRQTCERSNLGETGVLVL